MLLPLTMPFWYPRVTRAWRYSAAWTQNYGRRIAIGVKPARIIEKTDRSVGLRIYAEEKNPDNNIRQVSCHEIVHACSAHLRLPMWLNEGIAVITADRFMEKPTIREDTLKYMKDYTPKKAPPTYQELSRMDDKAIAYNLTRSYWLAHYLEKEHPGLIRSLLEKRMEPDIITSRIAGGLGIEPKDFWKEIDGIVTEYFLKE
jgi:hypothetical protein